MKRSANPLDPAKKYRSRSVFAVYCLVSMSVGATMAQALLVSMNPLFPLVFAALMFLAVRALTLWKPAALVVLAVGAVTVLLLYFIRPSALQFLGSGIKDLVRNVVDFLRGRESISAKNAFPLWFVISGTLCVFTFFEIVRFKRLILYFPACLLILMAYWYQAIDGAFFMIVLLVASTLFFYGVEHAFRQHEKTAAKKGWGWTALLYSLLVTLGAVLLPDFSAVWDPSGLVSGFESAFPEASKLRRYFSSSRVARNPGLFKFQETGFQPDDSVLGGSVIKNIDPVMAVLSAVPLYLRGNVKTFYIDNNWISETFVESMMETKIEDPAAGRVSEPLFKIEVRSLGASMRIAFSPLRTLRVDSDRYAYVINNEDSIITFPDAVYRDESYTLYASLSGDGKPDDSLVEPLVNPGRYLQLPRDLPARVSELASTLCEGIDGPFAKAAAMRDYLRLKYAYSLQSPTAPPGMDFVDYFLFELKGGYCTYFASALTLLLRTQGIPSRYVEGYLVQDPEGTGSFLVRQDDAHAWVEAYFADYGWVSLDATPGVSPLLVNAGRAYSTAHPDRNGGYSIVTSPQTPAPLPSAAGEAGVDRSAEELPFLRTLAGRILVISVPGAASLLLALLIIRILFTVRRERRYWTLLASSSDARQVVCVYGNILAIMALLKERILVGETALEFTRRIRMKLDNNEPAFVSLTDNFVTACYSSDPLPAGAPEAAYAMLAVMDKRLRFSLGAFRYGWIRYVQGRLFKIAGA